MPRNRVHNLNISLDGYAAGDHVTFDAPIGGAERPKRRNPRVCASGWVGTRSVGRRRPKASAGRSDRRRPVISDRWQALLLYLNGSCALRCCRLWITLQAVVLASAVSGGAPAAVEVLPFGSMEVLLGPDWRDLEKARLAVAEDRRCLDWPDAVIDGIDTGC